MNVKLDYLAHQGIERIKIGFAYDTQLINWIRKFKSAKWSKTHRTWYMNKTRENLLDLRQYAKSNNIFLDETLLFNTTKIAATPIQQDSVQKTDGQSALKSIHQRKKSIHYINYSPEIELRISQFSEHLEQRRYAANTIKTYISMVRQFFLATRFTAINQISLQDIKDYNHSEFIVKNKSYSAQNQYINAIKLFLDIHNGTAINLNQIERPKKVKSLPNVLTKDEIKSILQGVKNLKHKTLLSLIYACGLRIGEALNLKVNDIRYEEQLLYIKNAKGHKDRRVPLSESIANMLKRYISTYQPREYVFEGQKGGKYSYRSSQKILKRAAKQAGIRSEVKLHTLRHSYATHLLQNGTDLRYIQEILGHNSPKTTMLYTHVAAKDIRNIASPFDDLNI